jgi:hypothetical protein
MVQASKDKEVVGAASNDFLMFSGYTYERGKKKVIFVG